MKLYINYNFCGYRWFVINDILQSTLSNSVKLDEWTGTDETLRIVKKLMLYDSYDATFLQEEGIYILALRHIHEQNHKDPDGRKLSMTYIFEGTAKEKDLLEKILLVYINHRADFESVLSDLISAAVDHVDYNIQSLLQLLVAIKSAKKSSTSLTLGKGRVLTLLSKWRDDTISSNLGLKPEEFVKVKKSLEDYTESNLIDTPNITDAIKKMSKDELLLVIADKPTDKPKQEENKEEQDTNTIVTKPEPQHYRFSFKQFLSDLKSLFQGNMSWKEFRKKYCSELRFMCMGIVVGLLIGWCF